jgi:hypothetical protein
MTAITAHENMAILAAREDLSYAEELPVIARQMARLVIDADQNHRAANTGESLLLLHAAVAAYNAFVDATA